MPLKTVEWGVDGAIRKRGKPDHAQVDADRTAARQGLLNLSLRLDAHEPLATREDDSDVLYRTEHRTAVAVTQPTELGQEQARIHLVELDLLRGRITKAIVPSFFLETRNVGPFWRRSWCKRAPDPSAPVVADVPAPPSARRSGSRRATGSAACTVPHR